MDLTTITIASVIICILVVALGVARTSAARQRRIDLARNRNRFQDSVNYTVPTQPVQANAPAPLPKSHIAYDTSLMGLEVDEDITEEQADMIRLIFDDNRPAIKITNNNETIWLTTEPADLKPE